MLRSWIGLPPGVWPPPDRELLGLPADGALDAATVEAAALDRMAQLRTHQLLHPELVTEGMNRVAQAMMTVASGHAPRRPRAATPPPPVPPPDVPEIDLEASTVTAFPALRLDAPHQAIEPIIELDARPVSPPPPPISLPKVLDAVPVADPPPVEPPIAVVAPVPVFRRRPPVEPIRIPDDVPPPAGLALDEGEIPPHGRRAAYRELAGLRAVLRAFDKLRPSVALPGEGLLSPSAVCDLLEAVTEFRAAIEHPGLQRGFVRTDAPALFAILTHPLPLALFRSLTRTQRQALAREWAGGQAGVLARMDALRASLERPQRAGPWVSLRRRAAGVLTDRPEVLLVAASSVITVAALVKTTTR